VEESIWLPSYISQETSRNTSGISVTYCIRQPEGSQYTTQTRTQQRTVHTLEAQTKAVHQHTDTKGAPGLPSNCVAVTGLLCMLCRNLVWRCPNQSHGAPMCSCVHTHA
jgi:hypothetical protein